MVNIEQIDGFQSLQEFKRFEVWINRELDAGAAIEVVVKNYYAGMNFKERWFVFHLTDELWRLVYPDGPFKGFWGKVHTDERSS